MGNCCFHVKFVQTDGQTDRRTDGLTDRWKTLKQYALDLSMRGHKNQFDIVSDSGVKRRRRHIKALKALERHLSREPMSGIDKFEKLTLGC